MQDKNQLLLNSSIANPTPLEHQAREKLHGKTLKEILLHTQHIRPELLKEMVRLKRADLLNHLGTQITTKQFIEFIDSNILTHTNFIDLQDLGKQFRDTFQADLIPLIKKWEETDHSGRILWQDFKIQQEGASPSASLKVFNTGDKESFALETRNNLTDKAALYGVGLY